MKMRNELTGDILEIPPPDQYGRGEVLFNGVVVERVLYRDSDCSVTLENGTFFKDNGFSEYLTEKLRTMGYYQ